MQTVAETPTFTRQADKLFSEDDRRALIDHLAGNPLAGDEIPGTGASENFTARPWAVAREAARGVIYFYGGEHMPIDALLAYSKSARTDLSPA